MSHRGFEGRMSYINNQGSTAGQKGGKTKLTPDRHIRINPEPIADVHDYSVTDSNGPAMSVQSRTATQKGG